MRKQLLSLGFVALISPAPLLAQGATGVDYTNNVRSQAIGTPGQSTNPVDQLTQRQGLQDLSTGKSAGNKRVERSRPATKDELAVGATVNDKTGVAIAKIAQVDPDGIVLSIGTAKIKVPADAFGHNKAGLLLDMTKAQFEQVVAQAK